MKIQICNVSCHSQQHYLGVDNIPQGVNGFNGLIQNFVT